MTQPVLHRLFGDKHGLLDAVADHGYERCTALRAATQEQTGDPVTDLRAGRDGHLAFSQECPGFYRLMFAPRPWSRSKARERVFALLVAALVRRAAAGALTTEPRTAARLILSADVGIALNHIAAPALFDDPALSHRMRDAVFSHVLTEATARGETDPLNSAALCPRAQLALVGTQALEPAETALLERITRSGRQ
ncbi:WHG domain-containing protein [Streptomyces sp. NPDC058572]|uniref:WHG domain-containing protein n=1 Tax=Streptomyces sp. NPDC058572 TaxID=3346546 RepID=UPI003657C7FC